jgi:hypothetical protein
MSRLLLGTLCGLGFGLVAVLIMIPMQFESKAKAMTGAFLNRFAVGFVIGAAHLPLAGWQSGLLLGLLLSLPDAIITGAWPPILVLGALGGTAIGWIVGA